MSWWWKTMPIFFILIWWLFLTRPWPKLWPSVNRHFFLGGGTKFDLEVLMVINDKTVLIVEMYKRTLLYSMRSFYMRIHVYVIENRPFWRTYPLIYTHPMSFCANLLYSRHVFGSLSLSHKEVCLSSYCLLKNCKSEVC